MRSDENNFIPSAPAPEIGDASSGMKPIETEAVDIFVRIAQFLGLPKSVGEIYGLLFMSPQPLSLDDVCERLKMSKGSASQGLKQLRIMGTIKTSYVPGDRRDLYVVEPSLKNTVAGFLKERVQPGLADLAERVERLEALASDHSNGERKMYRERVDRLRSWQKQAQHFIPALSQLLGGKS